MGSAAGVLFHPKFHRRLWGLGYVTDDGSIWLWLRFPSTVTRRRRTRPRVWDQYVSSAKAGFVT